VRKVRSDHWRGGLDEKERTLVMLIFSVGVAIRPMHVTLIKIYLHDRIEVAVSWRIAMLL